MNETQLSTSTCRHCRFYQIEGRRGGSCQKLGGVPVQSNWKACALAASPFKTTLKKLEDIFQLETSVSLNSSPKLVSNSSKTMAKDGCSQMAVSKTE